MSLIILVSYFCVIMAFRAVLQPFRFLRHSVLFLGTVFDQKKNYEILQKTVINI